VAEEASWAFWIAIFNHELKDREFESGIISAAAVLGLEVEKGGWRSALSYTQILSTIITTLRALVVYWVYSDRRRAIETDVRQGSSEAEARPGWSATNQWLTVCVFERLVTQSTIYLLDP
jgi:hypothetical protein